MNPNINNISSFLTSIAEGHLYQSFYHQRMGLLRLGLVSECRVTKNTTNDTNFSHIFFNIFNVIVDYFKTTLTSADTKQKKWLLIPKVASTASYPSCFLPLTSSHLLLLNALVKYNFLRNPMSWPSGQQLSRHQSDINWMMDFNWKRNNNSELPFSNDIAPDTI